MFKVYSDESTRSKGNKTPMSTKNENMQVRVEKLEENLQTGIEKLKKQLASTSDNRNNDPVQMTTILDKIITFENDIKQSLYSLKKDLLSEQEISNKEIEHLKQDHMRNGIIIKGVAESETEDLQDEVCKLLKSKTKITVSPNEINYCYRMGKKPGAKHPRPIALMFTCRWERDIVFNNKKLLKGSGIVMDEMLVKSNLNLYKAVRSVIGVKSSWSWNGKIYAFINNTKKLITSEDDLNSYMSNNYVSTT